MKRLLSGFAIGCAVSLLALGLAYAQPRIQPPGGGAGGGGGGGAQPAPSSGVIQGTNAQLTARMVQGAGYTNVQVVEHQGQKHVTAKAGETPVVIVHLFCKEACLAISYVVLFGEQTSIDWNYINAWNSTHTFAKLSRNNDGSLVFSMDVILTGGVTAEYIQSTAAVFATRLKELLDFKPGQN